MRPRAVGVRICKGTRREGGRGGYLAVGPWAAPESRLQCRPAGGRAPSVPVLARSARSGLVGTYRAQSTWPVERPALARPFIREGPTPPPRAGAPPRLA